MKNSKIVIIDRLRTNVKSPRIITKYAPTRANFEWFMQKFNYEREHNPKIYLYLVKNGTALTSASRKYGADWVKISPVQAKRFIKSWELWSKYGGDLKNFIEKVGKMNVKVGKLPENWVFIPEKDIKNYNIGSKIIDNWKKRELF